MRTKLLSVLLISILTLASFSLVGCGQDETPETPITPTNNEQTQEQEQSSEATVTPEMQEAVEAADQAEEKVDELIAGDDALAGFTVQSRVVYPDRIMLYAVKEGTDEKAVFVQDVQTGEVTRQE